MKLNARTEWINTMIEYYRQIFPNTPEHIYYNWAEHTVDHAAHTLGDYFSFRSWKN
jgi:hypothetical protein